MISFNDMVTSFIIYNEFVDYYSGKIGGTTKSQRITLGSQDSWRNIIADKIFKSYLQLYFFVNLNSHFTWDKSLPYEILLKVERKRKK